MRTCTQQTSDLNVYRINESLNWNQRIKCVILLQLPSICWACMRFNQIWPFPAKTNVAMEVGDWEWLNILCKLFDISKKNRLLACEWKSLPRGCWIFIFYEMTEQLRQQYYIHIQMKPLQIFERLSAIISMELRYWYTHIEDGLRLFDTFYFDQGCGLLEWLWNFLIMLKQKNSI